MPADRSTVQVEIFGQVYSVRGGDAPGYIQDLARYVDQKMKEVAEASPTVDSLKIAILAALNISDDLYQNRRRQDDATAFFNGKTVELLDKLNACLGGEMGQ